MEGSSGRRRLHVTLLLLGALLLITLGVPGISSPYATAATASIDHIFVRSGVTSTDITPGTQSYASPAWSPDGAHIVAQTNDGVGQPAQLITMRDDGTEVFTATSKIDVWSADWLNGDTLIASERTSAVDRLYLRAAFATGQRLRFTEFGDSLIHPAVSPDGTHVAYVDVSLSGYPRLVLATSDGLTVTLPGLTPGYTFGFAPAWRPDGKALAYEHANTTTSRLEIYELNLETGNTVLLASDPDADLTRPAYAPDTSSITFTSSSYTTAGPDVIRLKDLSTGDVITIAEGRDGEWAPDGRFAYVSAVQVEVPDPTPSTTPTATVTPAATPPVPMDLALSVQSQTSVFYGEDAEMRLYFSNNSQQAAHNVVLSATVPISSSISPRSTAGWICTETICTYPLGTLSPGYGGTVRLVFTGYKVEGGYDLTFSIGADEQDTYLLNNQVDKTVKALWPVMNIYAGGAPGTAFTEQTFTATFTATLSTANVPGARIELAIPPGVTIEPIGGFVEDGTAIWPVSLEKGTNTVVTAQVTSHIATRVLFIGYVCKDTVCIPTGSIANTVIRYGWWMPAIAR